MPSILKGPARELKKVNEDSCEILRAIKINPLIVKTPPANVVLEAKD